MELSPVLPVTFEADVGSTESFGDACGAASKLLAAVAIAWVVSTHQNVDLHPNKYL